jgi:hypothetical protein
MTTMFYGGVIMPVESNKFAEVNHEIIETLFKPPDDGPRIVYGLRTEFIGDTVEEFTADDISADKNDVLRLITLLNDCGVSDIHLTEIVEDFVQSLYM